MSDVFFSQLTKEKDLPTKRITNARIVAIESVSNGVLASLIATRVTSLDNARSLFTGPRPTVDSPTYISFAEANEKWFKTENKRLSIGETDDSTALAAFISCSGVDAEHPEITFDAERELVFERTVKTMRIKAECWIEYDLNEQDDSNEPTPAMRALMAQNGEDEPSGASYNFEDDMDEDELYGRPSTKRAKVETKPAPQRVRHAKRALISGVWPLISSSVSLDVIAKTSSLTGDNQRFDAVEIVPHFDIKAATPDRVVLGDFYLMLRHAAGFHQILADNVFKSLFPTLYGEPARAIGACVRSLRAPEGTDASHDAKSYTVELDELIAAIDSSNVTNMFRVCYAETNLFPALAAIFLYPRAVSMLIEHYGARRWHEIVARGPALVRHMYVLMTARPHVLCFAKLQYIDCCEAQKHARAVGDELAQSADQENRKREQDQRDANVAALRWIATLPELSIGNYRTLISRRASPAASAHMSTIIGVAIDIYANIIRHDLFSGSDYASQHKRRGRGATSGHVFSVFGAGGAKPVPSETYDSGYSDGTLSLDVFFRNLRAYRVDQARRAAVAKQQVAPSNEHKRPHTENRDEMDDFLPVQLTKRTAVAVATPTVAVALPDDLSEDIARLAYACTSEQFCYALRWLCEQSILVSFTHVGTGPINAGRQFDSFYTSEMWATQTKLCATLVDIYRRALIGRLCPSERRQTIEVFNEQLAFRERARVYLRLIVRREQKRRALVESLRGEVERAVETTIINRFKAERKQAMNDSSNLSALCHLSKEIEAMKQLNATSEALDAYEDMLLPDEARLVGETDAQVEARMLESKLSDEQKEGVRHVMRNGITIFMSPGGCGKTFTVELITKCFPLDQIAVCALTGKACEVLLKQVGKVSTIHSLLVRETLHRQAVLRHQAMMVKLKRQMQETATSYDDKTVQEEFTRQQCALENEIGIIESRSPLANVRMLIVDETSLLDEQLMRRLFEFLHPLNAKRGRAALMRVVFLGDCDQLGSIEPGALLQTLCRAFPHCVRTFTVNFRSRGRGIFKLAQQVVQRDARACEPNFEMHLNERRLMRSPLPTNDSPEEIAAAEDASVVFVSSNERALQGDLRRTLAYLGAHTRQSPPSAEVLAMRDGIHIIAPTNALSTLCNTFCRELYFGQPVPGDDRNRYALAQKHLYFKLLRTDRVYFRKNRKIVIEVDKDALVEAAEYESLLRKASATERERARLVALASVGANGDSAAVDTADDIDATAQAMFTQDGIQAVQALDASMKVYNLTLNADDGVRRVLVNFYNSEILTLTDLYNKPRPLPRVSLLCVCGACQAPTLPQRKPGEPLTTSVTVKPGPCVRWPHLVPPSRRVLGDLAPTATVHYHDQNLASAASSRFNRMAVFRTSAGVFKQLDVGLEMGERSSWEYAWATTIHRFQGSGARVIIIVVPRDMAFADLCMLYTALTRAEERIVFIGTPEAWRCMARREPPLRRTELWFMLAQSIAATHTRVAELVGLQSRDGCALPDALRITNAIERLIMNSTRRPCGEDRVAVWRYYEQIRAREQTKQERK